MFDLFDMAAMLRSAFLIQVDMPHSRQDIALIASTGGWRPTLQHDQHLHVFTSLTQLPADMNPAAFLLADSHDASLLDTLRSLRGHARFASHLVFLCPRDEQQAMLALLTDGVWQAADEIARQISLWQQRQALLTLQHADPYLQRLLSYLWTREQGSLQPLRDWRRAGVYGYPLAECLTGHEDTAQLLIQQALQQGLLVPDTLHDRLRACPSCASAHLNYIDLCPSCHHHDIRQESAIHCFNCGHVAPQGHFRQQGTLTCPNCSSRLRHIGSDYDRPMENYQCLACSELFIEPAIRARCTACEHACEPAQLNTVKVHDYVLSERGKLLCRHGDQLRELQVFRLLGGLVSPELFRFNLSWVDQLCVRYPQQPYSLVALRLGNVPQLVAQHGYQATMQQLERLQQLLQEHIRSTDLATLLTDDLYLILLPNTPVAGVASLQQKIQHVLAQGMSDGLAVELLMHSYSTQPVQHQAQDTGLLLDALCNAVLP